MTFKSQDYHWSIVWTSKIAPAAAGVIAERIFTNESVSGLVSLLGADPVDIRSGIIFAFVIALTNPMLYIDLLCSGIEIVRTFFNTAIQKIKTALNKPVGDK